MARGSAGESASADGGESVDDDEAVEEAPDADTGEADADGEPSETNDESHTDETQKARRWRRPAIRWIAVVVFVAVLAGAGFEGWLLFERHQKEVAAQQALDAAQQFAGKFTNADPDTIDDAVRDITDGSTGEFKNRYVKSISQLRAMLIENKVTTRGTVVRSAVESVAPGKVEVLLFVKESFSSAALPEPPDERPAEPPTDVVGMAVTMEKVDGRWLVSKVVPDNQL